MAEFQYYSGEETPQGPKSTQTGAPAPPPNALQFFDDQTAGSQAWSNAIDTVMEAGTVAVDIATKLKEAEHQNQADAFFLDYTQKVQQLRDNINSGKAKSNQFDLQDINGVSDYYRLEEDKLYKDLSQKYNKQNYKRRDSIMRDRKAEPFLSSLSSVRRQKIQEISRRNAESFNTYMQAQTRELIEAETRNKINLHALRIGRKKQKKLLETGAKADISESIIDQQEILKTQDQIDADIADIIKRTDEEALKRLRAGTISQDDYDNLNKNLQTNVQTAVGYRLAQQNPQVFLDLHNNPELRKKAFGFIDPKTYSQYWDAANDKSITLKNEKEKDLSASAMKTFYNEMHDFIYTSDVDSLEKLIPKLRSAESYKGWDINDRISAESTLLSAIKSVKASIGKGEKTSVTAIGNYIKTYRDAHFDGQNDVKMPDSPRIKFDLAKSITDKEDLNGVLARVTMLEKTLPLFRTLKLPGSNQQEIIRKMETLKPDVNSPYYSLEKAEWDKVNNRIKGYQGLMKDDPAGVIRSEVGNPETPELDQISDKNQIRDAILNKEFNAKEVVESQISSNGLKYVGSAISDPNWILSTPIKVLSKQDVRLFGKLISPDNVKTSFPDVQQILKNKYGTLAPVAMRDLLNAGVVKQWYFYADSLTREGYQAHIEATKAGKTLGELGLSKTGYDAVAIETAFNKRMGTAIETMRARDDIKLLFQNYYAFVASNSRDELPDPDSVANRFFSGISIAEMPNHLPSHTQAHIWVGDDVLEAKGASAGTVSKGAMSFMIQFKERDVDLEEDLFVMGRKDLPSAHFLKMNPENIEKYPDTAKRIKKVFSEKLSSNLVGFNSKDKPIFTLVRNPDGETFALAVKSYPHGGIYRIGEQVDGKLKAITVTLDTIIDHGQRFEKIDQGMFLRSTAHNLPPNDDKTSMDMVSELRRRYPIGANAPIYNDIENQLIESGKENLTGAEAKTAVQMVIKGIVENMPERKEKSWYEELYDWGVKEYYDWTDPWAD